MSICGFLRPTQWHGLFSLWRYLPVFFLFFLFFPFAVAASSLDFTTLRLGSGKNAVLVVGGIQGDEPGGFSAASLLATRYEIHKGCIWVVPNLNFPSIIKRSRGLHGDMNRKFAKLDSADPEYGTVRRIQELISSPEVGLVLNLHDGSGYYRPTYEDKLKNPQRWGQSIIIDQSSLAPNVFMRNLEEIAKAVSNRVNSKLIAPAHKIHVHNTHTADGDYEMEKSLSYYAARHNKAAFGLEASKEFSVAWRTFYHLSMIENFLGHAGIEFSRDFELSPAGIERALSEHLGVSFAKNRIFLPLENARPAINYFPLPRESNIITSKPIMAVLPCESKKGELCIHYGNRTLTLIRPDWRDINEELDAVATIIDGEKILAPFGQTLFVDKEITVMPIPGFRVNAIGYECGKKDESGRPLRHRDFDKRFSVDRSGHIFRVEVYKDQSFAGMFLLRFKTNGQTAQNSTVSLPDKKGYESDLGF